MPIVASAVGGVPDMIDNEISGLLIQPNALDLANALRRLMRDEKLREQLGKRAKEKSILFSAQQMYEGYDKIYMSKWQSL